MYSSIFLSPGMSASVRVMHSVVEAVCLQKFLSSQFYHPSDESSNAYRNEHESAMHVKHLKRTMAILVNHVHQCHFLALSFASISSRNLWLFYAGPSVNKDITS
jgi:hypothetical protein